MSAEQGRDELLTQAVAVLTRAFREWPSDWAEFVSLATAGAAANIGSVETILSRRPGSWEADFVRQLLTGTVGHAAEHLWEHRTEPVHVVLYPLEVLVDTGVDEPYDHAWDELEQRKDAAWPAEIDLDDLTTEQRAALEAAEQLQERLDRMRDEDLDSYGIALARAVEAAAAARGLRVPVHVEIQGGIRSSWPAEDGEDLLALQLVDEATSAVPLPGATTPGQPPRLPLERLEDRP